MDVYIYYGCMLICFVASILYFKYPTVKFLCLLLFISILTETIVEFVGTKGNIFFPVYHYFVLAEYTLITMTLRSFIENRLIKVAMLFSIPVFILFSLYISLILKTLKDYPSININIESMLLIIWCLLSFISIRVVNDLSIFKLPVFWCTFAFFVYFSGTISFNSIYNLLLEKNQERARTLFSIFNLSFNYILYIFLTIGIISFRWAEKSSVQ